MNSRLMIIAVCILMLAGVVLADAGTPVTTSATTVPGPMSGAGPAPCPMMGEMAGQCPMMSGMSGMGGPMAGMAGSHAMGGKHAMGGGHAMTAWGGYVYILRGDSLTKFSHDLTAINSINVAVPPPPPFRDGTMSGSRGGGMMQGGKMSGSRGGGMMQGGKMAEKMPAMGAAGTCPKMAGTCPMMQGGKMGRGMMQGGNAQLAADANGVYLLRAGRLAVFDHDLKIIAATEIDAPESGVMMPLGAGQDGPQGRMQGRMMPRPGHPAMVGPGGMQNKMGGGPGEMGSGFGTDWGPIGMVSSPQTRIEGGTLWISSGWVYPREATISVSVRDEAGEVLQSASVSGFLYPKGQPERGIDVMVYERGGEFSIPCTFSAPGSYELALRIKRPGMADLLEYQSLSVD